MRFEADNAQFLIYVLVDLIQHKISLLFASSTV